MEINIILANESHTELLSNLGRKLFYETFSKDNTSENIKKYLDD